MRNSPAGLIISGCVLFGFGSVSAAAFFWKSRQPVVQHVASAVRMPIPGAADVELSARGYGVYFGMSNPPSRRYMRVPKLRFEFVPPAGVSRPNYVDLQGEPESRVDGFETIQIGRLVVHGAGSYHVEVTSEESVGSFSIGELPAPPSEDGELKAILIGVVVGGVTLVASTGLVASGVIAHRREKARMNRSDA